MKTLVHPQHQGRSGNIALLIFLSAYAAVMALVIAPKQVTSAIDAVWTQSAE